jgi:hypothetical protein
MPSWATGFMMTGMLVASAFCWLGALLAWLGYRRSARRCDAISEVPTIAARDIPGLGAAMVEVKGVSQAGRPLVSDLARIPCVAFTCSVTEHWTTTHTERDSKGNTRTVTEHHTETLYSNQARICFEVRDASGCATVNPDGASMDLLDTMGELSGPLADSPAYGLSPRHFGGHVSYAESALPVACNVYVLGQVSQDNLICRATDRDDPFIISYRTEEQLLSSARWGERICVGLAILLFLGGFASLGIALGSQ